MQPHHNVLVAIPTMGSMHPNLVALLIQWCQRYPKDQLSFYFAFRVAPVDRARNQIAEQFLKASPDRPFTHLFFIDDDTVPPLDALEKLLAHDKDIVSGLVPIPKFKDDGEWYIIDNCFVAREKDDSGEVKTYLPPRDSGLHKIFRCGTACLLIKRNVFEALEKPYFIFDYNPDHTIHTRSEDIRFCDNAIAAGFEIYADTSVQCGHEKSLLIK